MDLHAFWLVTYHAAQAKPQPFSFGVHIRQPFCLGGIRRQGTQSKHSHRMLSAPVHYVL